MKSKEGVFAVADVKELPDLHVACPHVVRLCDQVGIVMVRLPR